MEDVGIFLERWSTLWQFGIFVGHFGILFLFWYVVPKKTWQPWFGCSKIRLKISLRSRFYKFCFGRNLQIMPDYSGQISVHK
jgi:hypothetical protein